MHMQNNLRGPRLALSLLLLLGSANAWAQNQSVCGSCSGGTPPKASLTSPTNNSKAAAPATFNLAATASDDGMIMRVDFYANGAVVDSDTTYPYTGKFTSLVPGTYSLTAVAVDDTNMQGTSSARSVTVTNIVPSVSLTGPANGATAASPGVFTLTANASDADGWVARVDFRNGSAVVCRDATAPFSCVYSGLAPGSYLISAVATDNIGASTTSGTSTITVTGAAPGTVSETRSYYYDEFQRLCKRVNPESGASITTYDAAGNIAYTAESPASTNAGCLWDTWDATPIYRSYDELNRLKRTWIPFGTVDVAQDYYPDGAVKSVTAANYSLGVNYPVTTTYAYNSRGLLTGEASINGGVQNTLAYGYDANGNQASLTYPDGQVVTFSPDGLGRAQQVAGSGAIYAKAISYYPGGAIKSFSYGNDVVHTMTQNARRLPTRSQDIKGTTIVLDDTYSFDDNGNVVDITDRAQNGLTTRGMGYDGLDRLTAVVSPGQWGTAVYAYDALDNMTRADVGTRQYRYVYNPTTWRLDTIKSPAGATLFSMQYDVQGNLTRKNAQAYAFDPTNRLSEVVGLQKYRYDGLGRRVQTTDADGKTTFWIYSQPGQVLFTSEARRSQNLSYIYLGNTELASRAVTWGSGLVTTRFQHTDALGSPVAETELAGKVVKRNSFEPYGATWGGSPVDGTGYTGHVMDRDTGLTYMQQRYYDTVLNVHLSVDSKSVDDHSANNFCRYCYANSSPYRFVDPDGRSGVTAVGGLIQETWNYASGGEFNGQSVIGALRDGYNGQGDGLGRAVWDDATTFIPVGAPAKGVELGIDALRAAQKMDMVRELGRAGEAAAGILKNTDRIPSMTQTAAFRIPDGLTSKVLTEVKNYSGKLGLTSQLKDFMHYAESTQRTFVLIVGQETKISKSLQAAINEGKIVLRRLE